MPKGMIENREAFLDTIATQLGRKRRSKGVERPNFHHQVQWDVLAGLSENELVDVLEEQCKSIHTKLIRTKERDLAKALFDVIDDYGGKSVITWDDPRFGSFQLDEPFEAWKERGINVQKWNSSNGAESLHFAEKADVGITFSDITLAESGTVVLFSDKGKGRSVSLLPATYIAIVPKSTLVPRMSQATREIHNRVSGGERVPSCVNFITGPSNSADIEMNLVVGVHGPIKATYVVVEDR
ncbi:lactate utilization protein C [Aquibacillus sp. 3ASR75-54]|uniref:Lactate utilization protein C n=1 Tax=Aquibacillus salsiterrae TaxID=2950439 RepID=A0A9X3WJ75_9BACI|nr:lactate utilization protein C [Aquibacillus salsiterrae]